MEDKKKLQTEKRKKTESTKKEEGKSVRTRRLRSANERTNATREKNSVIIDGDRSVK